MTDGSAYKGLDVLSKEKAELLRLLLEERARKAREIRPYPRGDAADGLPTSWAQQRLWFIDQLEGGTAAYNTGLAFTLRGKLDQRALQETLDALLKRHEVLRTVFVAMDGEPRQEIASDGRFALTVIDLSGYDAADREAQIRLHNIEESQTKFDLCRGPLIRGRLLRVKKNEHILVIMMHHTICDAWSKGVMIREFAELYTAFSERRESSLAPLPIQYADYAQWQRQWLQGEELDRQLSYWRARLEGAAPQLELPTDRPRPAVQSHRGDRVRIVLDEQLSAKLKSLAHRHDMTLYMVLYGAWAALLSRLSGQEDVVIGTVIANRHRPELESLIGFFVNTLALRFTVRSDSSLEELFDHVKEVTLGAYDHQDIPFERVVEALQPERSTSRHPIFQAMYVFQSLSQGALTLPGLTATFDDSVYESSKFDLLLSMGEQGEEIYGSLEYSTDLFDRETAERWMACFEVLLRGIVDAAPAHIGGLPILPESERRQIAETFNATKVSYPQDKLLHELFEEQVARTPHAQAAAYAHQHLTYAELNIRANWLARRLQARGVCPGQLVAICMERSLEMLVGLLGILKAGGAYVPLDPHYPTDRLRYMLEDANPRVVVTQEGLLATTPATKAEVIAVDSLLLQISDEAATNLSSAAFGRSAQDLVYVIYTSGTTGRPKGTAMAHRSMVNLIEWHRRNLSKVHRVAQFAALSFDVAFQEIFSTLCTGGAIVLLDEWVRKDARALLEFLSDHSIERLFLPPLMLQSLAECFNSTSTVPRSLRDVITAGEQLRVSPEIVNFFEHLIGCRLHNHYGPTETHVVTALTLAANPRDWPVLPTIGRPISNTQIYVLDDQCRLVPRGIVGEIYIAGANVARGYLDRPDLTAQRFLSDAFSADPQARMYKTGDLGRWRPDGSIEYFGRNDDQVKIRGFRIELGEIEAQLALHPQVKEAAAIVREDAPGEKRLVAYFTLRGATTPGVDELRDQLRSVLPEHMLPSAFVMLERLPLTPSGKLDRRALPKPECEAFASRPYEAPQGSVETMVAEIWQAVLRVERVGRQDNFFELGGHSLLLVQVLERLRRSGLSTNVRSIYESRTLADLAHTLAREAAEELVVPPNLIPPACKAITPQMLRLVELEPDQIAQIVQLTPGGAENIQDIYPLVALQEGMLFHHLFNEQGGDTYLVSILLSLPSQERLQELAEALQWLIDRHDILRTAVRWEQLPRPVQVVYRRATLPVEELTLVRDRDAIEQLREYMRPEHQRLDVRQAPLMRLKIASTQPHEPCYAILQLQHLVCDHESLDAMLVEVMTRLKGRAQHLREPLPYRNHVAEALAYAKMHDAAAFFRSKLGDIEEPTAPFGLLDVHGDGSRIAQAHMPLEPKLAQRVRGSARRLGVSPATLFHAAWALVVSRTSGRDDVVFGSVLLGRLQGSAGAQRVLGLFMNTLPLRLRLHNVTVKELVKQTQRELAELLTHEQASLAVAQRCSGISGSGPLFSTLLNYRWSSVDLKSEFAGAGVTRLGIVSHTNYPITLSVMDQGEGFALSVQTDRRVEPDRVMSCMISVMQSLFDAIEKAPERLALNLSILSESERRLVIDKFNATQTAYPREKLIHELFEDHARRTPGALAVVHEEGALTYAEVNGKANQLAHYLSERGVQVGDYVPILMPRSLQMLIAQLAVLKCGGVYVPVDPSNPLERQVLVIRDCGARRVLADQAIGSALELDSTQWIDYSSLAGVLQGHSADNLQRSGHAPPPAYVMYTSGSTGVPKGVVVPHHAVSRLVINNRYMHIEPTDCMAHCSNPMFDASTFEIWGALLNGARLLIIPQSVVLDTTRFAEMSSHHGVTILFLTIGLLAQYTEPLASVFGRLRYLLTGGDIIEPGVARRVLRDSPPQHFINAYGPTESTTFTTTHLIEAVDEDATSIPIGQPISNTQVYILDSQLQPAPVGVTGEIYIGGEGIALGYLKRAELTAERFIAHPFSTTDGARLYKSGDLGRWRADGAIEFFGRRDHQVKIRGFRIELGEIEGRLAGHPQVSEAVVVAREDVPGEKRLVAYVTKRGDSDPTIADLRAHLEAALPEYMVPSAFVILEHFALTSSGKVDRRVLPAPQIGTYASQAYEAPQGEVEEMLARIWQELLHVERVGRQDNFFSLGGHSLLVLEALFKINRSFNGTLKVRDVYNCPTLQELAARIGGGAIDDELVDLTREAVLDRRFVPMMAKPIAPAQAILLTGATGFVGRFLLAQLLQDTDATIYCLVRAKSKQEASFRLRTTLAKWDLWRDEFEPRIVAVPGDLGRPRLGIDERTYRILRQGVDAIYHCGTSMNHLEAYTMAKAANVESARELLGLAINGKPKLINYVSTVSVFSSSFSNASHVIDETTSTDHEKHFLSSGYAASKWVGEKIFMTAAERGIPCNIFRLGLVWADTRQGRYDELQREYRLIKSCLLSGCGIKDFRFSLSPTPVDYVARAIVYLASRHPGGHEVFHISSTRQAIEGVFERCREIVGDTLELMSHYDWIHEMKRLHHEGQSMPVVPLIESAFSMDEASLYERQRRGRTAGAPFSCARTHRELERAGIVAPVVDDDQLALCVEAMLSRDPDLRERSLMFIDRHVGPELTLDESMDSSHTA